LILREGASRFTLDAVAREADVSKGGLLYHFPSKHTLIEALVQGMVSAFDTLLENADQRDGRAGSFTRAYLRASEQDDSGALSAGVAAAVAQNPAQLEPLREAYTRWQARLESDGIDRVDATIVRLATDGLWVAELLELPPLGPDLRRAVLDRLAELGGETP